MRKAGVIFLSREPILTYSQRDKLADILIVIGQLFAVSLVLPFVIPALDKTKMYMIVLGLLFAFGSWALSILIVRRLE